MHTHTQQVHDRIQSEQKLSDKQVTSAEAISELFKSNKNRRGVLHINGVYYTGWGRDSGHKHT